MDGLFHERVVVCESDTDCRFYSAILESITANSDSSPDLLFTHCGGKQRIATVIKALRKIGVPVTAIVDFDFLQDASDVKKTVEAAGGDFSVIEAKLKVVAEAMKTEEDTRSAESIQKEIEEVLAPLGRSRLDKKNREKIGSILRSSSKWRDSKMNGINMLRGNTYTTCKELIEDLKKWHLFVVPSGEAESFCRSIALHGEKWVSAVLELKGDLADDPELREARDFVRATLLS